MSNSVDIHNSNVTNLNRGGYLVKTPIGNIQFGSPPETIKDTMVMPDGVPQIFVLPNNFFNWIKGISVAEVEFPIYYNFFLKKRKTFIICNKEQYNRFKIVLKEAVFGPEDIDVGNDFHESLCEDACYNIKNELSFFRNNIQLSDLVSFLIFQDDTITFNGITITFDAHDNFNIYAGDEFIASVPGDIDYVPTYDIGERLPEPYIPPLYGITCLGPSHGFDPEDNTSGFIIWLNHKGIMVDPPVNSTEWLRDSNVNPKLVDSIILTHCHADHDAGTFQKILEEGVITIYTTNTIFNSFLRKYSALTNSSPDYLKRLFNFVPITIGLPEFIHSAKFEMFYSLHSIPTIGFKMSFQGKTFVYSSDHNNDPLLHAKLLEAGVIGETRYKELSNFPWDSDLIYHESGIAPLHTPIRILQSMPEDVKKRILVYHISKKSFPENEKDLKLAKFGIKHTVYTKVGHPEYEEVYKVLGVLNYLDFFEDIPIKKAQEFISIINREQFKKGDVIITRGTPGDKFYMIETGNVAVITDDLEKRKIYGACDYFGEAALVTGANRAADVIAETDVDLFTIEKDKFLHFIRGTELEKTLYNLAKVRDSESWNILSTSPNFQILTSTQKTMLESMFIPYIHEKSGAIIREGSKLDEIYIIRKGEVKVFKGEKQLAVLQRGDFIGEIRRIHEKQAACYTFINEDSVALYKINRENVKRFIEKNPGLIMKLIYKF